MKKTIYLVDDDELELQAIKRALSKDNCEGKFNFGIFNDGEELIKQLEGFKSGVNLDDLLIPNIIIMDLNMPRMSGFDALEEIRNCPKFNSVIVFILSTSKNPTEIKRVYQKNIAGYLVKDEMGNRYEKLANLLDSYSEAISFPPK